MTRLPGVYRALLRLLPADLRERFGDEMVDLLERRMAEAGTRRRRLFVFARAVVDVLTQAVAARASVRTAGGSTADRRKPHGVHTNDAGRATWRTTPFDTLTQDLRFGVRSLRRNPGHALTAIGVMTIAIGASATIFTLSERLLDPDPPGVEAPDRLVGIREIGINGLERQWEYPNYAFIREEARGFDGILTYADFILTAATGHDGATTQAEVRLVSDNFFAVLRTPMAAGRGFLPEEGIAPGTHPVAVLDHGFRQRLFGGDGDVVGRELSINGHSFTVAGVAPAGFGGIDAENAAPDVYIPIMMQGAIIPDGEAVLGRVRNQSFSAYNVIGRLADGMSLASARTGLAVLRVGLAEDIAQVSPEAAEGFGLAVDEDYQYRMATAARVRSVLRLLWLVAAGVLGIASANLAILLLARASARVDEIGVRTAIGAGRGRLLRQLMTESLLLGALGAAGGLVLAYAAAGSVAALLPFARNVDVSPDLPVVAFAMLAGLVVTVAFGIVPGLQLSAAGTASVIRTGRRTTDRGLFRNALVVGQIAASVVLVVGAGLFARSVLAANAVELGFRPEGRMIASVELGNHGYDEARGRAFVEDALRELRSIAGVEGVTVAATLPFLNIMTFPYFLPEGGMVQFDFTRVGPEYFEVMDTPIVTGRTFTPDDGPGAPLVGVVNETAARMLWPDENPVGQTLRLGVGESVSTRTVVGVARDAIRSDLGEETRPFLYSPQAQGYNSWNTFVVRSERPDAALADAMRSRIAGLDPTVAVSGVRPLTEVVAEETATYRSLAVLVGASGLMALVLAAIGLYGVQAYVVGRRSREIGIRMALGARAREVGGAVLGRGALLAVAGLALGGAAALGLSELVRSLLFGIEPNDPLTFAVVLGMLFGVALAASYVPARRASRVDPVVALRAD